MPIVFGDFTFDESRRQLLKAGIAIPLSPKAFQLLTTLTRACPAAVSKVELQEKLWPDTFVNEGSLPNLVTELRAALGDDAREPRFIRTLYGFGYSFTEPVREVSAQAPQQAGRRAGHLTTAAAFGAIAVVLLLASRSTTGLTAQTSTPKFRSIAVLPFDTAGADRTDAHLGLGLPDLVITRLTNLPQLVVRPTSAVRAFAGQHIDSSEAGRKLRVDTVLEGSIRTTADRVRVSVQLLNVREEKAIWAQQFDEKRADMLSIEDNISARVANALALQMTPNEKRLLAKNYTTNREAYDLYLEARYQQLQLARTLQTDGRQNVIRAFEQALEKDPSYALAWAQLAQSFIEAGRFGEMPPSVAYPKAEAAARKAIQLDDELSESHAALAMVKESWYADYAGAEKEYVHSLELNPRNNTTLTWYAYLLECLGRFNEAVAVINRAIEINPLSTTAQWVLANIYLTSRQDDLGIQQTLLVLKMDPNLSEAHIGLSRIYAIRGEYEKAIAEAREAIRIGTEGPRGLAFLGYAFAMSGNKTEARAILEQLKNEKATPFYLALVYTGLGERDAVFPLLEEGLRNKSYTIRLKTEPIFEPLRSDARFQAILHRAGFNS